MVIVRRSLLLSVMVISPSCLHAVEALTFQTYEREVLRMTLVSPSLDGKVLLRRGDNLEELTGVVLEKLFTLRVAVPCKWLATESVLYWSLPGRPLLSATIPAQSCITEPLAPPLLPPVLVYEKQGKCRIDTGGNTLWRVATEFAKRNQASIYQNVYAIFVTNKLAFAGEDIHRLRNRMLYCPEPALFDHIEPAHAKQMFEDGLQFHRKATRYLAPAQQGAQQG